MQREFGIKPFRGSAVLALALWMLAPGCALSFGFDDVAREADRLARAPYRQPAAADANLAAMTYDAYRKQRFRPEFSTWRGSGTPFELQYFPLGRSFTRPLEMFEVVGDAVHPLRVPAGAFENGASGGVAGWRLNRWIDEPQRSDEVLAFLGASYFRLIAPALRYGVSARGLAVDTVGGSGEEFPAFTTFWVVRPSAGESTVRFFALLESPRVTGAYAFVVKPGPSVTTIEIRARLTLREPVARLGIAPLTSMFLGGENQPLSNDYRPEVHDSDGLQVASGDGEWLWRPLSNPSGVFVTSFAMRSLRGFGLMQRDRAFTSYQDLEARYDLRPSAWVEPIGDWGAGRVELLQFRTPDETHDNVGAWWFPDRLPGAGEPVEFAWRLTVSDRQPLPPGAWVVQSRSGHGWREDAIPPSHRAYQLDFAGPALEGLGDGDVEAVASGNANVRGLRAIAYPNSALPGWRVSLDFERIDPRQAAELRVFLRRGSRVLSETWSHALAPE
ncbi:MAG: glucan biosynthesis protein [Ramlibacter sp.]|nr:glucan biosynthesis protein [Ramlibacter sp.]